MTREGSRIGFWPRLFWHTMSQEPEIPSTSSLRGFELGELRGREKGLRGPWAPHRMRDSACCSVCFKPLKDKRTYVLSTACKKPPAMANATIFLKRVR